ncbi:MAG: MBL fold metallo-hydrolase [Clostridia bacterium]|nr:MBL fold metallo-hydrolase [Clostridia bacterium]
MNGQLKEKILKTRLFYDQIALFYLGQVGYVVKANNKYILIDGYLSDYVDRNCASELVPWKRRYDAPMDAEELDFIDYVFCTHAHFDHADPDTLAGIVKVNKKAKYFVSNAIVDVLVERGVPRDAIVGLRCDAPLKIADNLTVTAIPAAHEELHQNENGDYEEVGFRFDFATCTLFHAGDGCPYAGLEEKLGQTDVLLVPINGKDYYRRYVSDIIGNFDSREAAILAKNVGAKLLVPTHFDLYDVNCVNPAHFVDTLNAVNSEQCYHIFRPGERYIFGK